MTTQAEMFPKTTLEVLTELDGIHRDDLERATKALDALSDDEQIAKRYDKAESRVVACRALVAAIDQAITRERERLTGGVKVNPAIAAPLERMRAAGVTISCDPTTGEVASTTASFTDEVAAELDAHGVEYVRDAPLPATVNGSPILTVSGPGVEPFTMAIGDRTRYAAIIYAYAEQAGITDVDEAAWEVVGDNDYVPNPRDIIIRADHGLAFTVEQSEKGA